MPWGRAKSFRREEASQPVGRFHYRPRAEPLHRQAHPDSREEGDCRRCPATSPKHPALGGRPAATSRECAQSHILAAYLVARSAYRGDAFRKLPGQVLTWLIHWAQVV